MVKHEKWFSSWIRQDNKSWDRVIEYLQGHNFNITGLISFELIEVEKRAYALSKVVIKIRWKENGKIKEELFFGCAYQGDEEKSEIAVPWRDNEEWIINPWDICSLYSL